MTNDKLVGHACQTGEGGAAQFVICYLLFVICYLFRQLPDHPNELQASSAAVTPWSLRRSVHLVFVFSR